ncbi:MAG: response regulator [Deltaproteobacteria bacterium]|jgi:signal transduction histidine kinase/DNA-binding response OmpR family regulator|nr:response regulator [Deltaproteobacteria bacterium]
MLWEVSIAVGPQEDPGLAGLDSVLVQGGLTRLSARLRQTAGGEEPAGQAFLTLSPELADLLGLSEEFLAGDSTDILTELIHPQDQAAFLENVEACLKGTQKGFRIDHLVFRPLDGRWYQSQTFAGAVQGDEVLLNGYFRIERPVRLPGTIAADSSDLAAGEHYRLMMDNMSEVCSLWDTSFRHLDSNEAVVPLFGLPAKESFTQYFNSLSPPYQPDGRVSEDAFRDNLQKTVTEGRTQFEWLFQTLEGDPIQTDVSQVRVNTPKGDILVSFIRDISSLKATEAAVERERSLLQKILDNSPIAFLVSVANQIRFFSPFARQSLGINIDESLKHIFANEEQYAFILKNLEKKGRLAWQETLIYDGAGRVRHMLLNAFKTEYYGDIGYLFWMMDITEMVEKEKALSLAREMAEASTKAKSEFLANMSHEIRTPMNAIIGLAHLTLQSELDPQQSDYVSRILKAAKTLLRIINDILDFSKIEAGKLEMEHIEFNLSEIIAETMELLALRAAEKNLEFYLDLPELMPQTVIGDPVRLSQILNNLVSNAIKFTAQGEVGIKIEISGDDIPQVITLKFTVRDSGIGMTQEEMNRLFTPFSQADTSTTRRYGGTGLGLTITKRLVEMMNGQIWCQSVARQGSSFIFTARFGLTEAFSREKTAKPFAGLKALAVDDNPSALHILAGNLTSLGMIVDRASSGESAINRLKAARLKGEMQIPDIIMADHKMGKMDGLETIAQIYQELAPARPPAVLMVAGLAPDDIQNRLAELDIKKMLSKPISQPALISCLSGLLDKKVPAAQVPGRAKPDYTEILAHLKGRPILLVEDNEVNQLVASKILKKAGFAVKIANNGLEALEMVQQDHFDLVLMDIQMPEMDGLTASREIRKMDRFKDLPIVAMTAHAMSGDRDLSLAAGMNDHVTKPIDVPELFRTLVRWIPEEPKSA